MRRLLVLVALLALAGTAAADRVPSRKSEGLRDPGTRGDITVPYTTNGYSTLGVWQGVAPRIYSSPDVEDREYPDTRRVYNLPFWGGVQSFGDRSNGAVPRLPGPPFPSK